MAALDQNTNTIGRLTKDVIRFYAEFKAKNTDLKKIRKSGRYRFFHEAYVVSKKMGSYWMRRVLTGEVCIVTRAQ